MNENDSGSNENMRPLEMRKAIASFARASMRLPPHLESKFPSLRETHCQVLEIMNRNKVNGDWDEDSGIDDEDGDADDEYEAGDEDEDRDGDENRNRKQGEEAAVEELLEDLYRKVEFEAMENEMRKNLEPLSGVHSRIESAIAAMATKLEVASEAAVVKAAELRARMVLVTSLDIDSGIESELPEENTSSGDELDDDAAGHTDKSEVFEEYTSSEEELDDDSFAHTGRVRCVDGWAEDRAGDAVGTDAIEAVYFDLGEELNADVARPGADHDEPVHETPAPTKNRAFVCTPFSLLLSAVIIGLGSPKAIASFRGEAVVTNALDWIIGVPFALASLWLGVLKEQGHLASLNWFLRDDFRDMNIPMPRLF